MNIVLWVIQGLLALLFLSGGGYKTFAFADVARQIPALPHAGWQAVGVIEIIGGLLLIMPAATGWMPQLTALAAAVMTVESLLLVALYASYSLVIAASNPLVWAVAMAVLTGFVAYGRYVLSPLT